MAADIKDAGGLAGIERYGVPWHGRIEGATLYTGKLDALGSEVTRAWQQPDNSDCWLVQRPGLPDPYLGDAAGKAAAALEGKELTNWALLSGAGNVHGKSVARGAVYKQRWLWVDDAGDVYAVRFGLSAGTMSTGEVDYDGFAAVDYAFADAITASFTFTRYGKLEAGAVAAPTVTLDHVIAAGALGQASPAITASPSYGTFGTRPNMSLTAGNMILRDLTPTGNKAIMEVHSLVFDTARNSDLFGVVSGKPYASHREMSNPLGFVQFSLSGTGAAPAVAMSVLATRAQALGSYAQTRPTYSLTSATVCDECVDGECWYACSWTESQRITTEFSGRIVGYGFDGSGTPAPVTMSLTYHADRTQTVAPVNRTSGTETIDVDDTYSASVTAGLNTLSINRAVHSLATKTYNGSSCAEDVTASATSDSGIAEWTTAESTTSGTGDCVNLGFNFSIPSASCGAECRTASTFTPFDQTVPAFVLPSGIDYNNVLPVGVFRFGAGLYSLFGAQYALEYMGSTGLVNASLLQKSYAAWNPVRTSYSRIYGAWNPATNEVAFPKAAPVNFV